MTTAEASPRSPTQDFRAVAIVLCADDYGIAPGVSKAIRHLISLGRLSATSCMTISPYWAEEAAALVPLREHADIGLHLTLTDQRPLGPMPRTAPQGRFPGLVRLMRLAFTRQLDRAEIKAELTRQLDRFEAELGRPPAYLDGHQHVHQLPVVRDVVLELYRDRLAHHGAYLRYCTEPLSAILGRRRHAAEALIISLLGRTFARRARAAGIPGNRRFSGVHDFSGRTPYGELFQAFLRRAEPGMLIMCHPGISDAALAAADPVTGAREEEYQYFLGDAFAQTLRQNRVTLARFSNIRPAHP